MAYLVKEFSIHGLYPRGGSFQKQRSPLGEFVMTIFVIGSKRWAIELEFETLGGMVFDENLTCVFYYTHTYFYKYNLPNVLS